MNWRAIGIGIAIIVLVWFAGMALSVVMLREPSESAIAIYRWVSLALGSAGDIAGGGAAGWIAGRRGAAHGAVADLLATVLTLIGGTVLAFVRMQGELNYLAEPSYWFSMLGYTVLGLALATISGAVAVAIRSRTAAGGS